MKVLFLLLMMKDAVTLKYIDIQKYDIAEETTCDAGCVGCDPATPFAGDLDDDLLEGLPWRCKVTKR